MENQHREIVGYRDLTPDEIALVNEIKQLAERVAVTVGGMENLPGVDRRWVAIGKTDLQTGFMALVRAVARPTSF